ncbi:MAG: 2-hydroxy-acid oxidase [Meiothermus sp.]|uniref:2-hydroxy-acid oxidase n=2 Tax=Meiothermus hypogaeus TaxID=884155 RepID=A0A511R829_9DEIN|nr:FAD-linked oxidase C-terminal domain-containing protein [Meiothermus hypogaeus]RIH79334.1 putative FAD-linked oxidoreductase [Meiothermus hypogaeus]GEM85052.1 2-hydroxy-acid oxidase [Meiothermus hypogaeus NBRC 106114]GIW38327.1 MAG: 2-hydroxy-acid oxidase [Meiothermus sp.]
MTLNLGKKPLPSSPRPTYPQPARTAQELQARLGREKVLLELAQRRNYSYDGIAMGVTPAVVVLPTSTADVVEAVRFANQVGLPIVARGAASGLSGGAVPIQESIVMSFTRMTGLHIDPQARIATVQPGVVTLQISELAKPYGLWYPPDPASFRTSTIGGNLAENAGGPMCFKKGVTGDYVLELEFVDFAGQVHRLRREAYDLVGLLVGSEGTLGLITEAKLRLEPIPRYTRTLMAIFNEVGRAAEAVSEAIAAGAVPSKLEFMDNGCINAVEDYLKLGLPREAAAILLVDTDGDDPLIVEEELAWVAEACQKHGATVRLARDSGESEALWKARRSISPAIGAIKPKRMNEDIAVPRSSLPEVVRSIEALGQAYGLRVVQFGHIGDGNLHPNVLYDPKADPEEKVWELLHEIARVALRHGGVLSGEHGIGIMKRDFMSEAVDPETLEALRKVKAAFDPQNRLNPGKVLPEAHSFTH